MAKTDFRREALSDALHLSYVENTLYKTNYLSCFFLLPLTEENAAAASVLSRLITDACEKYPRPLSLRRARAELYGAEISASATTIGETLIFSLSACFLKDRYALAGESILKEVFSFIREFLHRPLLVSGTFDPALCALEKKNAADDARAILNDKSRLARRRLVEIMYAGEPFSIASSGKPEIIEALTPAALTESFYRLLAASPAEVIFVGESDRAFLKETVASLFDGMQKDTFLPPMSVPGPAPEEIKNVRETMDVQQAHLCIGMRTPITSRVPDYPAFAVGNAVFGYGTTCKLFMVVREKLSLCYRIASIYDAQKGFLQVYAGIEAENRKKAEDAIFAELDKTQKGDFTEEELRCAKNTLQNSCRTFVSAPDLFPSWAIVRILSGVEVDPEGELAALEAVTAESAAAALGCLKTDTVYFLEKETEK